MFIFYIRYKNKKVFSLYAKCSLSIVLCKSIQMPAVLDNNIKVGHVNKNHVSLILLVAQSLIHV